MRACVGTPHSALSWNNFHRLAASWVAVFKSNTGPANQLRGVAACRSGASARAAPDRWRPFRLPATPSFCAMGLRRALAHRKGNTATQLFSGVGCCSLNVLVPARRGGNFRGTIFTIRQRTPTLFHCVEIVPCNSAARCGGVETVMSQPRRCTECGLWRGMPCG